MSLLSEIKTLVESLNIPVETGDYKGAAPTKYIVLLPMSDRLIFYTNDYPDYEIQSVNVTLYDRGNYTSTRDALTIAFLAAGMTITDRQYIDYESDTRYHHYEIDIAKPYAIDTSDIEETIYGEL